MKITVIVAAFRLNGVKKVIEDLDNQTYKDFEVIIINDNNQEIRDDIFGLIKERNNYHFLDNYTRCHFYGGISRNMGIVMSFSYFSERLRKTDKDFWIAFHDDDNLWENDYLETMVNAHKSFLEAKLIGVNMKILRKNGDSDVSVCALKNNKCDIGSFLYSKCLFDKYGLFPANYDHKIGFDWELIKKIRDGGENVLLIGGDPKFIFNKRK